MKFLRSILVAGLCWMACSCSFLFSGLDDPSDPKSDNYQGYSTVAKASEIEPIYPADGGTLIPVYQPAGEAPTEAAISVWKVAGAKAYGLRITTDAAHVVDSPLYQRTDYSSNILTVPVNAMTDGIAYYWQAGAFDDQAFTWGWSEVFSFTSKLTFKVGDAGFAGGMVFYDKGSYSDGWRYLEAAPRDQSASIQWYNGDCIVIRTGTAIGTGKANTDAIVAAQGSGKYAASICKNLSLGGYSDWFLPSKDELNLMYKNLKVAGLGGFSEWSYAMYWSSSQCEQYYGQCAWNQAFCQRGVQTIDNTWYNDRFVRAVRAF